MTNIKSTNEFLAELNNTYFKEDDDENACCPINLLPYDDNAITLPCNHKFNYISLFNYVYSVKKVQNRYNTVYLRKNEIQCPMCRTVYDKLLPYVPCENMDTKIQGITSPSKYAMPHKTCSKIIRSGKNKGQVCGKPGYHTCHGDMCEMHDKLYQKSMAKATAKSIPASKSLPKSTLYSDDIINRIWKKYTIKDLKDLLRKNGHTISGNKLQLIERVLTYKI